MLAAMNGHTAAVKLLLDMGSDINAQIETNRNTALTLACFQGRTEVVSLLLDRKANVEHRAKVRVQRLVFHLKLISEKCYSCVLCSSIFHVLTTCLQNILHVTTETSMEEAVCLIALLKEK